MGPLATHIREATGLTMKEFCRNYLDIDFLSFRSRLIKNTIPYADEALLICLVTGRSPLELFGKQPIEVFLLNGKESITTRIKDILKNTPPDKVNGILNDLNGIKIEVPDLNKIGKIRKKKLKLEPSEKVLTNGIFSTHDKELPASLAASPYNAANQKNDFDFIETDLFK